MEKTLKAGNLEHKNASKRSKILCSTPNDSLRIILFLQREQLILQEFLINFRVHKRFSQI